MQALSNTRKWPQRGYLFPKMHFLDRMITPAEAWVGLGMASCMGAQQRGDLLTAQGVESVVWGTISRGPSVSNCVSNCVSNSIQSYPIVSNLAVLTHGAYPISSNPYPIVSNFVKSYPICSRIQFFDPQMASNWILVSNRIQFYRNVSNSLKFLKNSVSNFLRTSKNSWEFVRCRIQKFGYFQFSQ